jgi:DNA-binding transcriptional MerR regulator
VSVDALRELARDVDPTESDIATTETHLNVSPLTLRYDERIGLVRIARHHSGHRSFDACSVRRLAFLTRMRTPGMSISDLALYVDLIDAGEDAVPEHLDMLVEHRDTLRAQIAQLQLPLTATEIQGRHLQRHPNREHLRVQHRPALRRQP